MSIPRGLIFAALLCVVVVSLFSLVGALAGYKSAWDAHSVRQLDASVLALKEQYDLAVQELQAGEYDLARQRFEYVLQRYPGYPGAADGLAEAMAILYATATPTAVPPTPTSTPTPDMRPIQDLLAQAQAEFAAGNWPGVIDAVVSMRHVDPGFNTVTSDSLLYRALRNRGIDKILKEANLGGGIYDLALAEGFGPLDGEAANWRNLARLYMIGSSFWEVFPEQAVYYFSQVAAAAPGLRDGSGWTARARYHASLIHLGNKLAQAGDWCGAQEQYDLAYSMGGDGSLQATAVYAAEQCTPSTSTATVTPPVTLTPTVTPTFPPGITPAITATPTPTATLPFVDQPTPTGTPTPTQPAPVDTPTPTQEQPPTPTETAPAPDEPSPTPGSGI